MGRGRRLATQSLIGDSRPVMQLVIDLVIAIVVVAAVVVPAAFARKRLFAAKPEIALGVMVGAAVLGLAIAVAIVRSRAKPSAPSHDDLFGGLCASQAAGD